jgi:hypothetical protein
MLGKESVSLIHPQLCCSAVLLSPVLVVCIVETGERCSDLLLTSVSCGFVLPALRRTHKTLPSLPCNGVSYHIVSFVIPNPQHTVSLYTFIYQESAWSGRSGLGI